LAKIVSHLCTILIKGTLKKLSHHFLTMSACQCNSMPLLKKEEEGGGKLHLTPLNYCAITIYPPNYQLQQFISLNYQNNDNVPPMVTK
jgi:hypothetical protein